MKSCFTLCLAVFAISQLTALSGGFTTRESVEPFLNGAFPSTTPSTSVDGSIVWEAVDAFPNLTLSVYNPMHLIPVPETTDLLLMGDQTGKLFSIVNDESVTDAQLVLDLEANTQHTGDSGLMGMAFHPDYGKTGYDRNYLYLFYRWIPSVYEPDPTNPAYIRVSRFEWTPGTSAIDPLSETVLINQFDNHNWHQGGGMAFGDDGFLYIALGDMGGANDFYDVAQKLDEGLFSGVLRIDVDMDPAKSHPIRRQPISTQPRPPGWTGETYTANYFIPNDNPWQSPDGDVLEEFYAIGLRNPYRMTRDPLTNQFWIGDVGQGDREEINILVKGANYQWPYMEGNRAGFVAKPDPEDLFGIETPPVFDYERDFGGCVVGGYVYRGTRNPELYGKYLFTEFNKGTLYVLDEDPETGEPTPVELLSLPPHIMLGFGVDQNGEIYITKRAEGEGGPPAQLLRLEKAIDLSSTQPAPVRLSDTGAFSDLEDLTPSPGVVPYDVIQPLWSDGADKLRWLSIPFGSGVTDDQITFSEQGNWIFPVGTVLIKHFELDGKKVETRFTIKGDDGEWYGLNYRWNEEETEAHLLTGTSGLEIEVPIGDTTKKWYFPSRNECFNCHTTAKGKVLGVKTRHLNRDFTYTETGSPFNQLVTLNDAGYFDAAIDNTTFQAMLTAAGVTDLSATLEKRIRSYLDINCSHCHTGNSIPRARFESDLRTPLFWQNLINAEPVNPLDIAGSKLVFPGDSTKSILYQRASSLDGCCAMPPLAKNEVDAEAMAVFQQWILTLDPAEGPITDVDPALAPSDHSPPTGSFQLTPVGNQLSVEFSEPVAGLNASEIEVSGGSLLSLEGTGTSWLLEVAPATEDIVDITIPFDSLHDENGNANDSPVQFQYTADSKTGLNYSYYEGSFSTLPDFTQLPVLKTGTVSELDLSPRTIDDHFAMRFHGSITVEEPGDYNFYLTSDDGSRLIIDGTTVINHDGLHGATTEAGEISLDAGTYDFAVEYFEASGNEILTLEVKGPGLTRQAVPTDWYSSRAPEIANPPALSQSINAAALPRTISTSSGVITIDIGVTTSRTADLVVDIFGNSQWYGGGRLRILPGTSLAELTISLINQPADGDTLFWNVFLTEPGGDYTGATLFSDVQSVEVSDEAPLPPTEDSVRILAAPTQIIPGGEMSINIAYEAVSDGYIHLSILGDDGRWIGGDSLAVTAGSEVKVFPFPVPSDESGSFSYQTFLSTDP